jgi:hypothetical protein
MATRGLIFAYDEVSNEYRGIYCHYDNYFEGTGIKLKKHYQDYDKVYQLINLGAIPFLGTEISEMQPYDDKDEREIYIVDDIKEIKRLKITDVIDFIYVFEKDKKWYWKNGSVKNYVEL